MSDLIPFALALAFAAFVIWQDRRSRATIDELRDTMLRTLMAQQVNLLDRVQAHTLTDYATLAATTDAYSAITEPDDGEMALDLERAFSAARESLATDDLLAEDWVGPTIG